MKIRILVSVFVSLFFYELVYAQNTFKKDTLIELNTVVVGVSRFEEPEAETTQHVVTIDKKTIASQNPQTTADLLGASGEVAIQKSQQGGGSPMIRGFSTNRLLITVDGVRMNNAIFRSGNLQNIISIDPFSVERAEVLFGPGSVMYGSDAVGGVMNFQTLEPKLSPDSLPMVYGNATIRYSSANNENTGHVDYNVGWKKWALVTSVSYFNFSDLTMGSRGSADYLQPFIVSMQGNQDIVLANDDGLVQTPSGYAQINVLQKVRFQPNEVWDFIYGFNYSTTSDYSRYDRLIQTNGDGTPRYAQFDYGPQEWMMNNLKITAKPVNAKWVDKMNMYLAHQHFEESRISRRFGKKVKQTRLEKVDAFSVNADFEKKISTKSQVNYGVESVVNLVNSSGMDENIVSGEQTKGAARYPKSLWASNALYVVYKYQLNPKMLLRSGFRYNHFLLNAKFDTTFYPFPFVQANTTNHGVSGNVGWLYTMNKQWRVSANLSNGFRSPNVDDLGKVFDSVPGAVVVPNLNLKPEYAYNAELGIAKHFGNSIEIDVATYYTYLNNALVRRDFTLNGNDSIQYDSEPSKVQAIQNAASAYVYGLQGGLNVKLPYHLKLKSNITWQKGQEELDDKTRSPLRHAAPVYGITHILYEQRKLKIDFYAIYSGSKSFEELPISELEKAYLYAKDNEGNPYSPSWLTLNIKAHYYFHKHLKLLVGIENITDLRYRTYSSGLTAAGRNFIITLSSHF